MAFAEYKNAEMVDPTAIRGVDSDVLNCQSKPPFVLCYSMNSWEWSTATGMFLPKISKFILQYGSNGHKKGEQGHIAALSGARARGLQVLDPAKTPVLTTGEDGKLHESLGYIRRHKCKGGWVYLEVWQHVVTDHRGRAYFKGANDEVGHLASRRMWVETGLIDPIPQVKANELIERMHYNADHLRTMDNGKNGYAEKAKVLDKAAEASTVSLAPKPKKASKSKEAANVD